VVHRPVRSGQQTYAEGADLILLTQVSEGAEVLADGHIHVYGALRGRALAGVRGDETARIFCQSLEAELVSIAGNFLLQDGFPPELLKKPVQIYLDGESLRIELLNN
jgi:septum site-determining protein MinC